MNTATHPLRCRCGRLQGHVTLEGRNTRVVCYCKDCQAFARFLDPAGRALDAQSAVGEPKPRTSGLLRTVWTILGMVLGSRLSGRYRDTPFFDAAGAPVATPQVLSVDERARLRAAPGGA